MIDWPSPAAVGRAECRRGLVGGVSPQISCRRGRWVGHGVRLDRGRRRRRSAGARRRARSAPAAVGSPRVRARAHEAAQEREPPVEIGETYEFGVVEFTDHHSGERVAVGKVEGFVLFAEDVPDSVTEGDAIRARVLSFNRGRTSADAAFVERA